MCFWLLLTPLFSPENQPLPKSGILDMVDGLSNWGRLGADDELGTINLITTDKRRQAAIIAREGIPVYMTRDVETAIAADNPKPFEHTMLSGGQVLHAHWCSDNFSVFYHRFGHSHIDFLCNYVHEQKLYNGISAKVVTPNGARKLDVHNLKNGIFTRGILIDDLAFKDLGYLEPGTAIYTEDREAWERKAAVKVSPGDVVSIYKGRRARRDAVGLWSGSQASLYATAARWLGKRDIELLGSYGGSEMSPSRIPGVNSPVHLLMLHTLAIHMLNKLDLKAMSAKTSEIDRWDFLLTVAPLAVLGGTGSPLNPLIAL